MEFSHLGFIGYNKFTLQISPKARLALGNCPVQYSTNSCTYVPEAGITVEKQNYVSMTLQFIGIRVGIREKQTTQSSSVIG